MIKLYMNSVHAACGVGRGATNIVRVVKTWSVNAEGGIRRVHAVRVGPSTVYRVKADGIVLVEKKTSLNANDLYERGYALSVRVSHSARRRKPALCVSGAFGQNPRIEDATTLRRAPKRIVLISQELLNSHDRRSAAYPRIPRTVGRWRTEWAYGLKSEVQVVRGASPIYPHYAERVLAAHRCGIVKASDSRPRG